MFSYVSRTGNEKVLKKKSFFEIVLGNYAKMSCLLVFHLNRGNDLAIV